MTTNLLAQHARQFVPLKSSRSKATLQGYQQAELLPLDELLAEARPKRKRFLTKENGTTEALVTLYPSEYRPPKRW